METGVYKIIPKIIDTQADGGCHVKDLNEIGKIEIVKVENKGKNNRRIYYDVKD